jgi:hypothetical protein
MRSPQHQKTARRRGRVPCTWTLCLIVAAAVAAGGCAYQHAKALSERPANPRSFDFSKPGEAPNPTNRYYFTSLKLGPNNTDDLFVVLTLSGGGIRAASLAYGVLDELRRIKIGCTDPQREESCGRKTLLD